MGDKIILVLWSGILKATQKIQLLRMKHTWN